LFNYEFERHPSAVAYVGLTTGLLIPMALLGKTEEAYQIPIAYVWAVPLMVFDDWRSRRILEKKLIDI